VISPSQRPLPDNTQQSQQTNIHAPRRAEDFYLYGDISQSSVCMNQEIEIKHLEASDLPCTTRKAKSPRSR